jgi:SSS family solute:Na+ symporter
VLVVGLYFWCTNQFVIQRALGARSLEHGRWGALLAGALKLPNLFILILPGVMAVVLYPGLDQPDMVFPLLAFDLLPVGVRGLMLAALAAAILSSLEAILNSASTLFTMDFVHVWRPEADDRELVAWGRGSTVAFMALAALWAPQIADFPTLWQYLQSILSYVTPPAVAVFLAGIFWRGATERGAFWTLALGIPLGTAGWVANEILGLVDIHFLYASGVMLAVSALTLAGVSALAPGRERATRGTGHPPEPLPPSRPVPAYLDYRLLSVLLLTAAGVIVFIWR